MYKLLIVEDELSTRKWFAKVIDWAQSGFEVVAIMEDGQQAWEFVQQGNDVDVVMTDIRMPNMDGLELAQHIRSLPGKPLEIVVLSGFGEFEYAQQAIKLGVRDYLLKPATKEQLTEIFDKIACRLDERHLESSKMIFADQMKKEKESLEKAHFYERWLVRKESQAMQEAWMDSSKLKLQPLDHSFFMLVAECDDYAKFTELYSNEDQKLCRFIVHNILDEIAQSHGAIDSVVLAPNQYIFLMNGDAGNGKADNGLQAGLAFQTALSTYLRLFEVRISVGCSPTFNHLSDAPAAYDQAVKALEHKFFMGKGTVQSYNACPQKQNENHYPIELEKMLIASFKQNDETEGYARLDEFLHCLCRNGGSADAIRFAVGEMLVSLFRQLREVKSLPVSSEIMESFIEEIRRLETYAELVEKAKELIRFVLQTIAIEGLALTPVAKGVEYMKLKLGRDISLQEISDYVGISPSYFSALFKQEKGHNFVDFLVRLRMEKSLELLEQTSLTVAQIGEEIGYQSYRYFTKVFKDYYRMTPTQFRDKLKRA